MRYLAAFFMLLLSINVKASFVQEYCSNGEGTVMTASGHNNNFVQVTERFFNHGNPLETKIKLRRGNLAINKTNSTEIARINTSKWCWQDISTKQISISKNDGTTFSKNIVGVSEDKKSVNAFIICEKTICSGM